MGFRLPGALKGAGIAAVLLAGAMAVLPGHVGAQTPVNATLVGVTANSPGTGLVTLSGFNQVAVTLNGGAYGALYNVYTCTTTMTAPTPPSCQIAGTLTVGSGGQATGTLASAITTNAIAEVFVQNARNTGELYAATLNGAAIPGSVSQSCIAGSLVTFVNGLPTCTTSGTGGIACNSINFFTGQALCVPVGGLASFPLLSSFNSFGLFGLNTTCVVGGGLQPVLVNGTVFFESC